MFVLRTFQLRVGLLYLLLVLALAGRRGCGQRGVCVACRWILLEDMRVTAFVFWYQILRLDFSCDLAVVSIFVKRSRGCVPVLCDPSWSGWVVVFYMMQSNLLFR